MLDKRGNKFLSALGHFTLVVDTFSIRVQRPFKWAAFIIMSLVTFEVIMRYVMKNPVIWGIDARTYIYGTALMFAASYTLIMRGHVTVDILMVSLPLVKQRLLEFWNYVLFFTPTVLAIAVSQTQMAMFSWKFKENAATLWAPPMYPFKTCLALAYWTLFVTGFSEAIKDLITVRNGNEEWLKER